jgi:hypothetical protein
VVPQQSWSESSGFRDEVKTVVSIWGRKAFRHKRSGPQSIAATSRLDPARRLRDVAKADFINHRLGSGNRRFAQYTNPFERSKISFEQIS